MRDRLIKLIKHDNCRNPFDCSPKCKYVESDDCHSERLADLILADGWIRPPCEVGDKVYSDVLGEIEAFVVMSIELAYTPKGFEGEFVSSNGKYPMLFSIENIGKTVFHSQEEAEAKLQEGKG